MDLVGSYSQGIWGFVLGVIGGWTSVALLAEFAARRQ